MIGRARSVVLAGLTGHVIDVEAHRAQGLPAFTIVGLPDASLAESKERVRAAVASSGLEWPRGRVTVNLSPASLPKSGSGTDLAIAVAVMAAGGVVDGARALRSLMLGELGLDGRLRPVLGVLPAVAAAVAAGHGAVVVPAGNLAEAALVPGAAVTAEATLAAVLRSLGADAHPAALEPIRASPHPSPPPRHLDLGDVHGQTDARLALEVAAAGGHHLLMVGPPGAGKTMLAERLPGILPPLDDADAVAATSIHSLAGMFDSTHGLLRRPPLEAPHHTASAVAIVGGGSGMPRPGAISRAHAGVLFLDEAPEFPARVLETLRQPLERGEIVLHRARGAVRYPARFQLVMAANPCPCGLAGVPGARCECTPMHRRRYFGRLSGPLLDRVDLQVALLPVGAGDSEPGEPSAAVAARVLAARERARMRLTEAALGTAVARAAGAVAGVEGARPGDAAPAADVRLASQAPGPWLRAATPRRACADLWRAVDRGALTARGFDRVLRVAWTLADLDGSAAPGRDHVGRALVLRQGGRG